MTKDILSPELEKEEEIVAELARLGVRYLSRLKVLQSREPHLSGQFIADLTRQPSSRVRSALIPLFLVHPEYSKHVQEALKQIDQTQAITLKFFYTAATLLQKKYPDKLQNTLILPDLFSSEIHFSGTNIDDQLRDLGKKHQQVSGRYINWRGSYENAAKHLFRQWELEEIWNK